MTKKRLKRGNGEPRVRGMKENENQASLNSSHKSAYLNEVYCASFKFSFFQNLYAVVSLNIVERLILSVQLMFPCIDFIQMGKLSVYLTMT